MTAASDESPATAPDTPADAEWPPREWREAQRGFGAKSMWRTLGWIAAIMVVLVVLSFWGMSNG
jgi:hypothetical protein